MHRKYVLRLTLLVALASAGAVAQQTAPTPARCEIGPVEKVFGGIPWDVFGCTDGKTVVIVSTASSPANPFYFVLYPKADAYGLAGEGTGQKSATQPTFDELKKLSTPQIQELAAEAARIGSNTAK